MKLTTLSLRDNPISDITTIVQHLSGLEMLDLSSTEVTIDKDNTIELSSFAPLINLTELYLSRVEAYYLENEAEAKLPALKILDVSGNPFTTSDFNLRVFRTLPNLEELSLRDAVMDHLSVTDIRQDLPALKRIYLDGNNFNCTVLQILLAHFKEKGLEAPGQSSKCHPGYDNVQGLCCKSYGDYIPPVRPQGSSTLDPTKDGLGTTTRSPAVSTPIDTPSIPPSKTKSENEENGSNQLTLIIICTVIGLLVVLGIALLVYKQVMKRHQPVPTSDNLMPDL
uniref:Uncharacterized protein n=1 Tax=Anopheles christyi TaxID=43041 RepID=A0A182K648_9DIPT